VPATTLSTLRRGAIRGRRLLALGVALGLAALTALPAPVSAGGPELTFKRILSGYERPVLVTHDGSPAKRLYIVEQTGRIKVAVYRDGAWRKAGVFLDLRAKVLGPDRGGSEQGLLGLAFAPDYATSGRFYVNFTRRGSGSAAGDTVVAELRRKRTLEADPASFRRLLVIGQPYDNHNGGHLAFGPDGRLYIATGDGGAGGDPGDRAQDLTSRLGKLLRIDPVDPDGSGPKRFEVPADNPFIGETEKNLVWLSGVRNPWRFSFDRETGDLWIGDVGQATTEEIDRLPATAGVDAGKGANLGWNVCEGDRVYPGSAACPDEANGFTPPVFFYRHNGSGAMDDGCSVTGGVVVRGPEAAAWQGRYLFSDFCSGFVGVLDADGDLLHTQASGANVVSFGEDAEGRIFLVGLDGAIRRVRFSADGP
jgi:glucose/arabinose dehydrogenase